MNSVLVWLLLVLAAVDFVGVCVVIALGYQGRL